MMGAHHAACGAAAWTAITLPAPLGLGLATVDHRTALVGLVVCAGAALLPDADHHSGSIAWSLPPLSRWVTRGVGKAFRGHRNGTHSLLGTVGAALFALVLGLFRFDLPMVGTVNVGAAVLALLLAAFATDALGIEDNGFQWVWALCFAVAAALWAPDSVHWFAEAVILGYLVHLAGDMLTVGGVPLLWPYRPRPPRAWRDSDFLSALWRPSGRFALPLLGTTGSVREWLLAVPVTLYAALGAFVAAVGILNELGLLSWAPV